MHTNFKQNKIIAFKFNMNYLFYLAIFSELSQHHLNFSGAPQDWLSFSRTFWILPIGQEMACHFSQDYTMVTKFLGFIHKHPKCKVVKSFFYCLDRFSRNLAKTAKKLQFFEIKKRGIDFFSFFSKQKSVILFQIPMKIVLSFLLRCITFV